MYLIRKKGNDIEGMNAKEITAGDAKSVGSSLAGRIMAMLAEEPLYPKEMSRRLKVNEQKVYYHVHNLEKSGLIQIHKKDIREGTLTKYYRLASPCFAIRFGQYNKMEKITATSEIQKKFLEPFVVDGRLDAKIVVGSPDPHGPEAARARDTYYALDLAVFLGSFLSYQPGVAAVTDTELRDMKNNLILIGGPITNKITDKVNKKMPVYFDKDKKWAIRSSITKKIYPSDECGLVVKIKNPFDSSKFMLIVAGKRHTGTRAAILALIKNFDEICLGNKKNSNIMAKVVEGRDEDADGVIDSVSVLE